MADPGSYLLIIECERPTEISVGALGSLSFEIGLYGYAGSAFGPGGLSRVDRHRRVAAGDHSVRHWHIDYLLGSEATRLVAVEIFPERDVECTLATEVAEAGCDCVDEFGASDCDCESHLWGPTSREQLSTVAADVCE